MTKDAWLNDRIMDAAKNLICKALGKIDSFQSVLNSQKQSNYSFRSVNNKPIQLLHDGNSHWLLYFYSSGRVQICDSMKSNAGWFTLRSLNARYRNFKDTSSGNLTLSLLPVQKQEEGFNCNAFAIAYAADILDGKSTIDARLMYSIDALMYQQQETI